MRDFAITPSIAVTIGRQTRLYHAYVTTAPAALDSPSTLTLYLSTLADVAGFAANPVTDDARDTRANGNARAEARLVLVDAGELAWQRARCRGNHHIFTQADPCWSASPRSSSGSGSDSRRPSMQMPPATRTHARHRSNSHIVNRPPDRRAR